MKICVTSTGPGLDTEMEPRFGRCAYFLFIDSETMVLEALENPNVAAGGGAGIQSAQLVANKGVEVLITGQVGPNAFTTLQAAGIRILTGRPGTVRETVEAFKAGNLSSPAQGPTVQAHFGMGRGGGMGRRMGLGRGAPLSVSPPVKSSATDKELNSLKEESDRIKAQLDKVMQKLENLDSGK